MKSIREFDIKTQLYCAGALLLGLGALPGIAVIAQLGDLASTATTGGQLAAEVSSIRTTALVLLGCGVGAGILLCPWIAGLLTRPLAEAMRLARAIADGRLDERIAFRAAGQAGALLDTLQQLGEKLHGMVRELKSGSESIMRGSGDIANGSIDLSSRTEQQAASLEKTATSMEELTSTVKQNAEHAHQASRLAVSASEVAVKGGAVVSEVVGTMASINESSKRIAEIIGVIDGIAFQTNILALNAAVEAARAGEQGRGFAVVASEVRSLAQRSAAAAKEIKELIDDSVEKVNAGTQLADKAGSTMNEVVTSVKRVTDIIAEIADASAEQTTGIEQVNQAIAAMDQATQQNAALVDESAAAAAAMREQAGGLARIVAGFGTAQAPAQPAPKAAPKLATEAGRPAQPSTARPAAADKGSRPIRPEAQAGATPARPRKRAAAGGRGAAVPDVDWEEF